MIYVSIMLTLQKFSDENLMDDFWCVCKQNVAKMHMGFTMCLSVHVYQFENH
jgi:hypothetical protein